MEQAKILDTLETYHSSPWDESGLAITLKNFRPIVPKGRLISKSAERALPIFKVLKKAGPMKWTPEAEAALQDLKAYLSSAPTLVAANPQESLLLYLDTSPAYL